MSNKGERLFFNEILFLANKNFEKIYLRYTDKLSREKDHTVLPYLIASNQPEQAVQHLLSRNNPQVKYFPIKIDKQAR